jgi:biofilm PGA synthesis protein PgaA
MYRASPEATREAETYLRATILAGLARSYADQLAESQQYFEALLAEMPHNTQIRHELANVYRWRGWTDRSLSQYAQILAVEPDFLAARIANTHTLLDAREYELAEYEMAWLEENYGEETAVQNLAHRWRLHNRSELQLDARFGESSGVTFGEDQYEVDTTWYSRPFANRYRALVRTHDAFAEFPEGESHRRRASAGVEYRYRRWQADAAVSVARSGGDSGLGVGVDYRFSDVLSLGGRVETESNATPLRGYRIGISSNLASVTARYAWHESTAIGATLSAQNLSDGNSVRSWLLLGEQRLLNRPRYKITLIADLYGSERERDDVAYFSPTSDFSWTSGLRVDWSVYRRFRFDVSQSLSAQVGQYNQAGYSAGGTWSAEYRLSVAMGERWYANIGALRLRRFFDGLAEYATFVVAGFSGRF